MGNTAGVRQIKKYANRKLYDMTEKKYVSLAHLSELIKAGEEISIMDNDTGEDITAGILSQLLAREKKAGDKELPSKVLMQLLRRGSGSVVGYARKYTSLWQNAFTMAEDEIDRLINRWVKDKEISESEGSRIKREITGYADNVREWILEKIDQRINEALSMMNLATRDQVRQLQNQVEELARCVERLEEMQNAKEEYEELA